MRNEINSKIAVVISREGMGDAPAELSLKLVKTYPELLAEEKKIPAYICLYGNGVKLICKGSPVIDQFKQLENEGSKIVICKTCLIFNELLDKTEAGTIGTMADIIDIQHNCTKIINL